MRNATPVLPFKMRRPPRQYYFYAQIFDLFHFFTHTTYAKINPGRDNLGGPAPELSYTLTQCTTFTLKTMTNCKISSRFPTS